MSYLDITVFDILICILVDNQGQLWTWSRLGVGFGVEVKQEYIKIQTVILEKKKKEKKSVNIFQRIKLSYALPLC